MKFKQRVVTLLASLALIVGGALVTAPAASAAVSGSVQCSSGSVEGIYIHHTSGPGGDGWATITSPTSSYVTWSYSNLSASSYYYVAVGCGNPGGEWDNVLYGPTVTNGYGEFTCMVGWYNSQWNRCFT